MTVAAKLIDRFGRIHTDLRLSITDRCNIRCTYCMPASVVTFQPRAQLLTYEEIARFVRIVATMGIRSVRITGGEPLVRSDVPLLVTMLKAIPQLDEISLTTNGMLLAEQAPALRGSGLDRINISLDTLREQTFRQLSRRPGLDRVFAGIEAASAAGFCKIRLNAIAMRNVTEPEIVPLAKFARERKLELRFIEFMPLDAEQKWQTEQVLSGGEIRRIIESEFGPLKPVPRDAPSQPAIDFEYADGCCRVGFINPVSEPFCGDCNRLRLTCEGQVRNCLFSHDESDARTMLRSHVPDDVIREMVRLCVARKLPGHGIDSPEFLRPGRAMYQIGG